MLFNSDNGIDDFIKDYKISEQTFIEWINQVDRANFTFENYQQWMIDNGHVTTEFAKKMGKAGAVFKSFLGSLANIGAMWLIGEAINLIFKAIDKAANSAKYAQEAVDDLMDSFNSALSTANSNLETFDKLSSRYKELSSGVNKLGQNVALTSEEYEEYNELVNQIAEMSPTLVAGYTTEGNAILTVAGNVDELRSSFLEARDAAYEMLLASDAVFNNLAKQSDTGFWAKFFDGWNWSKLLLGGDFISRLEDIFNWDNIEVGKGISNEDAMKELEAFQNLTSDQYRELQTWLITRAPWEKSKTITNADGTTSEFTEYILDAMGLGYNFTEEDFTLAKKQAQVLATQLHDSLDDVVKTVRDSLNASLVLSDDYDTLLKNEDISTFASLLVNSIDIEMAHEFDKNPAKANHWVESLIDGLIANGDEINVPLDSLLNLDIETLSETMNPEEIQAYVDGLVQQIVTSLNNAGAEIDSDVIISGLNLQSVYDSSKLYRDLPTEFHDLVYDKYFEKIEKEIPDNIAAAQTEDLLHWFETLSAKDRELAYQIVKDTDPVLVRLDVIKSKFEELKSTTEKLQTVTPLSGLSEWLDQDGVNDSVEDIKSNIDTLKSTLEKLKDKDLTQEDLDDLLFELFQQFPELSKYTDGSIEDIENLRLAIANLCTQQPQDVINELKELAEVEGITDEAKEQLLDFASTLENLSNIDLSSIFDIEMDTTKDVINDMQDGLKELAEFLVAINDEGGIKLNFEEAREYLKTFPELLQGAKYCADGTVQLNEDVTNEFIKSRESQIRADGKARIAELTNAKAMYESEKTYAEAKLKVIEKSLEAGGKMGMLSALERIENVENARNAFIQAGVDEVKANAEAAGAISGDTKTLTNYLAEAVDISTGNIDSGTNAMIEDANQATNAFNKTNLSFANIGTGNIVAPFETGRDIFSTVGTTMIKGLSGKTAYKQLVEQAQLLLGEDFSAKYLGSTSFKSDTGNLESILSQGEQETLATMAETAKRLEEMKGKLEKEIVGYDEAIESITQQIEMINVEMNAPIDSYVAGIINSESDKKSKEASEKVFDWIEVLIKNVERELQHLETTANSTYTNWTERNSALASQMAKTREEIGLQQAAYLAYMQKAESVGLSSYWKNLAKNGALDISIITDENLAEQISTYQEYIDKAKSAEDSIVELTESLSSLYETAFNNVVSQNEKALNAIENTKSLIEEELTQIEDSGHLASTEFYQSLIATEKKTIQILQKEKSALISSLNDAVNSGAIDVGSESWNDLNDKINEVNLSIEQATTSMIGYSNSIRDLEWQVFDLIQSRIEKIRNEADFLLDLMSDDKLVDENGKLTDEGQATVGLHAMNYNVYMAQADKYADELLKINKELANDKSNQTLIDRRDELLELQQEMIQSAEDEKQAIIDLVDDGYQAELDALQELIDKKKEAMDEDVSLRDYQNDVEEKSANIASLKKQADMYANDDSEEGRLKRQELQNQLAEAEKDLEETTYERFMSDSQALLDSLYAEYEALLNQRIDDTNAILQQMIEQANLNSSSISQTISEKADSVGYTLSDAMTNTWNTSTGNITTVLTMYGDGFTNSLTTVNDTLNSINSGILALIEKADAEAKESLKSSESGIGNVSATPNVTTPSTSVSTSPSTTTQNSTSSTTSKPTVSNSTSSTDGSFFIYSRDSFNKNKLNKETSIVDRLKWHDYSSTFAARKMYYNKMGFSGTYIGSSKQNSDMLQWMKLRGFSSGAYNIPKSQLAWTQESGEEAFILPDSTVVTPDGRKLTLIPEGTSVLNPNATENMYKFFNAPVDFMNGLSYGAGQITPVGSNVQSIENHIDLEIALPNVTNYAEFKQALRTDKEMERIIQAMTVDAATGRSLARKRHV